MKFGKIFDTLDSLIRKVYPINDAREQVEEFYGTRKACKDLLKEVHYDMDVIDGKSSALLTHISVMFVVIGLFLSDLNGHWIVTVVLVTELIIYLAVALLLLRCVDVMGPPFRMPPDDVEKAGCFYKSEVALRRGIYQWAVRMVFVLTIVLIPVVVFEYTLRMWPK